MYTYTHVRLYTCTLVQINVQLYILRLNKKIKSKISRCLLKKFPKLIRIFDNYRYWGVKTGHVCQFWSESAEIKWFKRL